MIGNMEDDQQDGDQEERGLMGSDQDPSRSSHRRCLTPTVLSIRRERSFGIDGVLPADNEGSNAATSTTMVVVAEAHVNEPSEWIDVRK
jgi:hypothetical protein